MFFRYSAASNLKNLLLIRQTAPRLLNEENLKRLCMSNSIKRFHGTRSLLSTPKTSFFANILRKYQGKGVFYNKAPKYINSSCTCKKLDIQEPVEGKGTCEEAPSGSPCCKPFKLQKKHPFGKSLLGDDSCKEKKETQPCGQKQDPCGQKQDPCGQKQDPCGQKQDPCGQKSNSCGPCAPKSDPCGEKKHDSCSKVPKNACEPCGKQNPNECPKKIDPCEEYEKFKQRKLMEEEARKNKVNTCLEKQKDGGQKQGNCKEGEKKKNPCEQYEKMNKKIAEAQKDSCNDQKQKDPCKPKEPCKTEQKPCKEDPCKDPCKNDPKIKDPCKEDQKPKDNCKETKEQKPQDPCQKPKEPCKDKPQDPCQKPKEPCKDKPQDPCQMPKDPCKGGGDQSPKKK